MGNYDVYYMDGCENREIYQKMIRIATTFCDAMSFIFLKTNRMNGARNQQKLSKSI